MPSNLFDVKTVKEAQDEEQTKFDYGAELRRQMLEKEALKVEE